MSMTKTERELILNDNILASHRWIREHRSELQQEYQNRWIAVSDEEVVAAGDDPDEVDRLAQQKTGKTRYQIPIVFIEDSSCIYHSGIH